MKKIIVLCLLLFAGDSVRCEVLTEEALMQMPSKKLHQLHEQKIAELAGTPEHEKLLAHQNNAQELVEKRAQAFVGCQYSKNYTTYFWGSAEDCALVKEFEKQLAYQQNIVGYAKHKLMELDPDLKLITKCMFEKDYANPSEMYQ